MDGLGDGVALDCPSEDLDFMRTTSFGLLQARLRPRSARCDFAGVLDLDLLAHYLD